MQLQAANIVLETQIAQVEAHLDGLTKFQKLVGGVKARLVRPAMPAV